MDNADAQAGQLVRCQPFVEILDPDARAGGPFCGAVPALEVALGIVGLGTVDAG